MTPRDQRPESTLPIDFWPHPLTTDERCVIFAEPGKTLREVLEPHLSLDHPAVAAINGELVVKERWGNVVLRQGDVVQVRLTVADGDGGSNPIAVVLSLAVLVAAPYLAGFALTGQFGGFGLIAAGETALGQILTAAIGIGGILIINSLFPPRLPDRNTEEPKPIYSLSGGSNRARPYEPLQLLLGNHRMFPDLAAREYTEYDSQGDQYLNQIVDFGLGDLEIENRRVADTPLADFEDVSTQQQVRHITLVKGNVDTIQGGEFDVEARDHWDIERTTADDTTRLSFDIVSQHFVANNEGALEGRTSTFDLAWREEGSSGSWNNERVDVTSPNGAEARNPVRRTFSYAVPENQYDVRARIRTFYEEDANLTRITFKASLPQIRAYQDDQADFTGRNPLALRIKASGQLYGRIQTLNADVSQLIDDWVNGAWIPARITSNPASILLKWLRGFRVGGTLVAGYGLEDDLIDFEGIQQWHAFCVAEGLECNVVIQDNRDEDAVARLICQCGWGRLDISTGKYGVAWEDAGRPVTAVVTPANIVAGSLSVGYDNENLADEIIGTFIDRDSDYQDNTLRRPVPNLTITGEFPINIPLEAVTNGTQAAKEINRTAAAQFYHQRIIGWEMTEEGFLGIGVGDVVGMANGLIGNGVGGRLMTISADRRTVETSFGVENSSGTCWVGQLDGTVLNTSWARLSDGRIRLASPIVDAPTDVVDTPLDYRIMLFPSLSTAYTKVRVTGIAPAGPGRYRYQARDEVAQFYDARVADLTYDLLPVELLPRPPVSGFSVDESEHGVRLFSWSAYDGQVVGHEIRYGAVGSTFANMTRLHEVGFVAASPYESIDRPREGTWLFGVVAILRDGRTSRPAYTTATLGVPRIDRLFTVGAERPDNPRFGDKHIDPDGVIYEWDGDDWVSTGVDLTGPTQAGVFSGAVDAGEAPTIDGEVEGSVFIAFDGRFWGWEVTGGTGAWVYRGDLSGRDGLDGKGIEFIFRRTNSLTSPGTPSSSAANRVDDDYVPSDWTDDASGTNATNRYEWVARRVKATGAASWGEFSSPALWGVFSEDGEDGVDGAGIQFIFRRTNSLTSPGTPASSTAQRQTDTEYVPSGWLDDAAGTSATNRYEWVSKRVLARGGTLWSEFTNPVLWGVFSEDGEDGEDGVDGVSGAGIQFIFQRTTSISRPGTPSSSTANRQPNTEYVPSGWTDDAAGTNATNRYEWVSKRVLARGGMLWSNFTSPALWGVFSADGDDGVDGVDGVSGAGIQFIFRRTVSSTPGRPSSSTAQRQPDTEYVPSGWTDDPIGPSASVPLEWVSKRVLAPGGTLWTNFTSPTRWAVYIEGPPGEDGLPGPRIWRRLWSGNAGILASESAGTPEIVPVGITDWTWDFIVFIGSYQGGNFSTGVSQAISTSGTFANMTNVHGIGNSQAKVSRSGSTSLRMRRNEGTFVLRQIWGVNHVAS